LHRAQRRRRAHPDPGRCDQLECSRARFRRQGRRPHRNLRHGRVQRGAKSGFELKASTKKHNATLNPKSASNEQRNRNAKDPAMLKMSHLSKEYRTHMDETQALRDFSVPVGEGEFVAVTGPSCSGKTTFLNIAGLLEDFSGGEYWLDGVDVPGMNNDHRSRLRN